MKALSVSFFLILFITGLAQDYYSDRLFVKVKEKYATKVDFIKDGYLKAVIREADILSFEKPFRAKELNSIYELKFKDEADLDKWIKAIEKLEYIEYAERIPIYKLFFTPNDPQYSSQWNLAKIQAGLAWNFHKGNSNVKIAVTDDGFLLNHEDLVNQWYVNTGEVQGNGIDDDGNGYIDDWRGWDAADNDNNPAAFNPSNSNFTHGTHVAGIVAAQTNNSKGIASIGYNCKMIPVKIGSSPSGWLTGAYQGLDYAINASGADVINMSWGGNGSSATYQILFNLARSKGIICVAAAGNSNSTVLKYPASYNHVISVASTKTSDALSGFSSYGSKIDVCAPGTSIPSCLAGGTSNYGNLSGTSMASPLVAGLCALMKSYNPMHIDSIESCLKRTCDNINAQNSTKIGQIGAGRINAYLALQCMTRKPISDFDILDTFQCIGKSVRYRAKSYGVPTLTYNWSFPSGSPSSSTSKDPIVTYGTNGYKSATLITSNSLGSDTLTKTSIVNIDTPSASLVGKVYTGNTSNPAFLIVNLKGNPPFNVTLSDGTNSFTKTGVTANPYFFSLSPTMDTSYISISSFSDSQCVGNKFGVDTIYKSASYPSNCDSSLVACYSFDGNANDQVGNNHGTVVGATLVPDRFGNANSAYSFDGSSSYINLGSSSILKPNSSTISLWVKINSLSNSGTGIASNPIILAKNTNSPSYYMEAYNLYISNTGSNKFYTYTYLPPGNSNSSSIVSNASFGLNNWYHLVVTYDNDSLKFYINGNLDKSVYKGFATNFSSTDSVILGYTANSLNERWFNGVIDDLKIYNRVLSQNEIQNIPVKCCDQFQIIDCDTTNLNSGLIAHYSFENNTNDVSGNNNHGTQIGGVTYVPGKKGQAVYFDGVDDYIQTNTKLLKGKNNFAIAGWLKLDQATVNNKLFNIYRENNNGWYGQGIDMSLGKFGSNNHMQIAGTWCKNLGTGMAPYSTFSDSIGTGDWHCFVLTRGNDTLRLYIDGVVVDIKPNSYIDTPLINGILGGWYKNNATSHSGFSKGLLDEVRFYNRALAPSEVKGYCKTCQIIESSGCDTTNLNTGLVLHLPFDGNTNDASGNGNHATNTGATLTTGKDGQANTAYSFNGTNSKILVSNFPKFSNDKMSISLFFKSTNTNQKAYAGLIDYSHSSSGYRNWAIQHLGTNGVYFSWKYSNTSPFWANPETNSVSYSHNKWNHLVVIKDGDSLVYYLNCQRVLSEKFAGTATILDENADLNIGFVKSWNRYFEGAIDDVRIYNRVLAEGEMKALGDCCSISSSDSLINHYAEVISTDSCNSFIVDSTIGFYAGDTIIVIQMKGATVDTSQSTNFGNVINMNSAGNYEFNVIKSISGNKITLENKLKRTYQIPEGRVQFVTFPKYSNYQINHRLTCRPWNGKKGGVFAMNVSQTLTFNETIDVSGKGFRGGKPTNTYQNSTNCNSNNFYYPQGSILAAPKGESYSIIGNSKLYGKGKIASGGGSGNDHNSGGGGGGNGSSGGFGGYQLFSCTNSLFDNRGIGGIGGPYSNALNKIFVGSGGGAGHCNNAFSGIVFESDGGDGGGLVIVNASTIVGNNKSIESNGANAIEPSSPNTGNHEGMGGGGAGGTILLNYNTVSGNLNLNANGGKGGNIVNPVSHGIVGPGGGGSGGVVWLSAASSNFNINATGGLNGVYVQNSNNPHGATSGQNGQTLTGLQFPISTEKYTLCDSIKNCTKPQNYVYDKCTNRDISLIARNGTNYQWSPNIDLSNTTIQSPITNTNIGRTYLVLYTDTAGCAIVDTFEVNVKTPAPYLPLSDQQICLGDSVRLTIPIFATNIIWSPGTGISSTSSASPHLFPITSTIYYLEFIDTFGCKQLDTVLINVIKDCCAARARFSLSDSILCFGDQVSITNTSKGLITSYDWNFGNAIPNSHNTSNPPPLSFPYGGGTYPIRLIVGNGSCTDTMIRNVYVTQIVPNAGMDTSTCENYTVVKLGEAAVVDWSYSWTPAIFLSSTSIANPICQMTNDSIHYILEVTDASSGCKGYDTVLVQTNRGLVVSNDTTRICDGDSVLVNGNFYKISGVHSDTVKKQGFNCDSIIRTHVIDVLKFKDTVYPKEYHCYRYRDPKGRVWLRSFVYEDLIKSPSLGCDSLKVTKPIEITSPVYRAKVIAECKEVIYKGERYNESTHFADTIVVKGTASGCDSILTYVHIAIKPMPKAEITASKPNPIHQLDSVTLSATGGGSYTWLNDNSSDSSIVYQALTLDDTVFKVRVTNVDQCSDTAIYTIKVILSDDCFYGIPNVFTPNGDGRNDVFIPNLSPCANIRFFAVYNRIGEKMFETTKNEGWNGYYNGKRAQGGVYVYYLELETSSGLKTSKGSVTLIR